MKTAHLVWHRAELRTHDHPALRTALDEVTNTGGFVLPVVILDRHIFVRPDLTPRRRAWFVENVRALREKYRELGADLIVRQGDPVAEFQKLAVDVAESGFALATLDYIRNFTPYAGERDRAVTEALKELGLVVRSHPGQYTCEPGQVLTNDGGRYGVYSPYRRKWSLTEVDAPAPRPKQLPSIPHGIQRGDLPRSESDIPLPETGEDAALRQLHHFQQHLERDYETTRDQPWRENSTSRTSWYYALGVLSPRLAARHAGTEKWRAELTWRDFLTDVLDRCPHTLTEEYDSRWRGFPWREDKEEFELWQQGRTGYPIVDAGMRELNATGFMHNRVRMICASFLTKHLLIDWRWGEAYFHSQLLDGDRAQNVGNWQWCAGCGVDAAPYFRVFNPVSQGQKFDPRGEYVKRWVPELGSLPEKLVHKPWEAGLLKADYPEPAVELELGRDRFLSEAKRFLGAGLTSG